MFLHSWRSYFRITLCTLLPLIDSFINNNKKNTTKKGATPSNAFTSADCRAAHANTQSTAQETTLYFPAPETATFSKSWWDEWNPHMPSHRPQAQPHQRLRAALAKQSHATHDHPMHKVPDANSLAKTNPQHSNTHPPPLKQPHTLFLQTNKSH